MTYARIENGNAVEYPLYEGDIRLAHPNVSFPAEFVAPDGYAIVRPSDYPEIDHTKNVVEGQPVKSGSNWVQNWVVSNASAEEIAERIASQWQTVRSLRGFKLSKTDWTQLPDAPADAAAWTTYRQALRDITNQADPFNITWPNEPA
jgi:hypothetical protein